MRLLIRASATAMGAGLLGVAGAFIAYRVGDLLIDWRLIRIDPFVDDDAAMKNFGVAMIGGLAGLAIGALIGWRASRRRL